MAQKKFTFQVDIEFQDSIYDGKEVLQIQEKILRALVSEVDMGNGFAPDESETFTREISVKVGNVTSIHRFV